MYKKNIFNNDYSNIEANARNWNNIPTISATVVIPFFKRLDILDRSLASLTLQNYPQDLWDVIIVEDGSPESVESTIEKYLEQLNISRLRHESQCFELATARNIGIKNSTRDVILLIDFDIVCLPDHLKNHLRWFENEKRVATFGLREFVDLSDFKAEEVKTWINTLHSLKRVKSVSNRLQEHDKRISELKNIKSHSFPCNLFHGCNVAFRRKDAIEIGLFDTDFNGNIGYEDIEFGYRLHKLGCYIVYEPDTVVFHQENETTSIEERDNGRPINLKKMYDKIPGFKEFRNSIGQK